MTPSLTGLDVLLSLAGYIAVYAIMFPAGLWMVRAHRARRRLADEDTPVEARAPVRAGQAGAGRRAMIIFDFVPLWTLILGLAVFFYVLLDGFDLGVGILYNFARTTTRPQPADEFHRPHLGWQ